jgi:hypothetical protein
MIEPETHTKDPAMSQTFLGEVRDGVVVFETDHRPPDGAKVRVEPLSEIAPGDEPTPSLADRLASVIGQASGLPADLAEQHDHYLHGTPKR